MRRIKKPSTKKARYSYDPELEQGYAILRNLDSVEDIGTAMQSHDRDIARQIDSRAAQYWRENAEELEWERKKEQDREVTEDRYSDIPTPSIMGGQNQLGTFMQSVGAAYNHVRNNDIPNMPNDYGMEDFLKDQWNSFFGEMNTLQAEDAKGYQVRALNDKTLINTYLGSLDILDQID